MSLYVPGWLRAAIPVNSTSSVDDRTGTGLSRAARSATTRPRQAHIPQVSADLRRVASSGKATARVSLRRARAALCSLTDKES